MQGVIRKAAKLTSEFVCLLRHMIEYRALPSTCRCLLWQAGPIAKTSAFPDQPGKCIRRFHPQSPGLLPPVPSIMWLVGQLLRLNCIVFRVALLDHRLVLLGLHTDMRFGIECEGYQGIVFSVVGWRYVDDDQLNTSNVVCTIASPAARP